MFLEGQARLLAIVHGLVGCALVASTTHLAVWARPRRGGYFRAVSGCKRFAIISLILYGIVFILGSLVYPSYRVTVREALLEEPVRLSEVSRAETKAVEKIFTAYGQPRTTSHEPMHTVQHAASLARLFDIKEHWVALGTMVSFAIWLFLSGSPRQWGIARQRFVFVLCIMQAAIVWFAAVVGLTLANYKAVGGY